MEKRGNVKLTQFRFDPKTRWAIELIAHQRGPEATATSAVRKAIHDAAARLNLGGHRWDELYDDEEGVRILRCLAIPEYELSDDEEELRAFVLAHREFFYSDPAATKPRPAAVALLWPKISEYRSHWITTRRENPGATARLLAKALKDEGLPVPKGAAA